MTRFLSRVLLIAYPVVEILLLAWVGGEIGWTWTVLLLLAGFGLGLALMRNAGVAAFQAVAQPLRKAQPFVEIDPETGAARTVHPAAQPTADDVARATLDMRASGWLFVAGLLFAAPGFISDAAGAVLALPPVRRRLASRAGARPARSATVIQGETVIVDDSGTVTVQRWDDERRRPPVIQGEILPPPQEPSDR